MLGLNFHRGDVLTLQLVSMKNSKEQFQYQRVLELVAAEKENRVTVPKAPHQLKLT
jgi:hypothetical protein